MVKKIIIPTVVVFALAFGWFGYKTFTTTRTTTELFPGKIVIGNAPWPGYLGLYVAADKGFFKEKGLDVEVREYQGFADLSRDYLAGNMQGRANLTLDAINEAYGGMDHKVVVAIDFSNGSDGIIASQTIKEFVDIKGKRVAFEHGSLEEFFLRYALDRHDLDVDDIIPVDLDPENSAKAVVSGEADAAVTYEPFMSQAVRESGVRVIYSSAEAPGLITDVLTFRSDFIKEHPETVRAIIEAYFKGVRYWKENPGEANAIIAARLKTAVDQVPGQLAGLVILDKDENRSAFTFAVGPQSLYGNMRGAASSSKRFAEKTGLPRLTRMR